MRIFLTFFLLLLFFPSSNKAQQDFQINPDNSCFVELPEWASLSERYAWNRICEGQTANMSMVTGEDDGAGCSAVSYFKVVQPQAVAPPLSDSLPSGAVDSEIVDGQISKRALTITPPIGPYTERIEKTVEYWPTSRHISPKFIELITTKEPYLKVPKRNKVSISCAIIDGHLDLTYAHVPNSLILNDSVFLKGASFAAARFDSNLSLDRSAVLSEVEFWGSQIGGAIFMRNGIFHEINAIGLNVRGNFEMDDSEFLSLLNLNRTKVGGSIFMRGGAKFKDVDLTSATISSSLDVRGAVFKENFYAFGLSTGGSVFMGKQSKFKEVELKNARIGGNLYMDQTHVESYLNAAGIFVNGFISMASESRFRDVYLSGARISGNLNTDTSQFSGVFDADDVSVNNIFMRDNAKFENVELKGAFIEGNFEIDKSRISGLFEAYNLEVGNSLFMRNGSQFEKVNLTGAHIGGSLEADSSSFSGPLSANSLSVKNDLYLSGKARFKSINLIGTVIGGSIYASNSLFDETFSGEGMQVGRHVIFRNGSTFAKNMIIAGATVEGHIQLQGSTFLGDVDLTETKSGSIMLWRPNRSGIPEQVPIWGPEARLILRNARSDSLQFRMPDSWLRSDRRPLVMDPVGFVYTRLGGLGSSEGYDLSAIGDGFVETLLQGPLVKAQNNDFVPQPYMQLESVLRDMGADRAADSIALARNDRRTDWHAEQGNYWAWTAERFWSALTGYGYRPFRILWWFAALVLVGALVARRSNAFRNRPRVDSLWYSMENAMPVIQLSGDHRSISHPNVWIDSFFHIQKLLGFVLATVLIGALTLLGG
ncbi:hypothetical protein [Thalassococcus profundi]|uniref:hypothetical protein n=1 Tax=Thalassococcus profundi TaxID=2282382 RepID=UPI00405A2E67